MLEFIEMQTETNMNNNTFRTFSDFDDYNSCSSSYSCIGITKKRAVINLFLRLKKLFANSNVRFELKDNYRILIGISSYKVDFTSCKFYFIPMKRARIKIKLHKRIF
jgi:hypothetical protein